MNYIVIILCIYIVTYIYSVYYILRNDRFVAAYKWKNVFSFVLLISQWTLNKI